MTPHQRAVYQYEKFLDWYLLEESRGTPIYQLEQMDVNLYFELRKHRKKREQEQKEVETTPDGEPIPNTTIDAVFNF
ncbi:hypothetical protein J32TS2_28180 [Shouchella clausii]|uniref:hypothetical protein n=1 Tax=Shouchella clausii TaxID=79880 RepID=UPI000BA7CF69|nr:hypothetical protein [Shouchella clausii]PAD46659.1 hypothetical protein CHI09_11065 [Shouchella clausii]GIN17462.1 hypothetical protein J32TS2_28180 [Shouchella clausii]